VLTIAWTWPLSANLSRRVPHDTGDPVLNTWILWWNTQALPFTERWWSPPVFFPLPGTFALSEHLAGIALFTTPMQFLGVSPLAAYNVALIASYVLSGYFTFLLARYLVAREGLPPGSLMTAAAFFAGMAFAFAPYRSSQLAHLQVLTTQWMPLALLAMHAYVDGGRRVWLVVFGFAWVVQALSNGYYLLFMPVLLGLWGLWFVDWRHAPRRGVALAAAFAASSLLLVPVLLKYKEIHDTLGLARNIGEMRMFSGRIESFGHAGYMLKFWPYLHARTHEAYLFPGLTATVLVAAAVVVALVRRRGFARAPFPFYVTAMLAMWWLAFGPGEQGELWDMLAQPYTLLTYLPGFNGLRVPARIAMLGYLCLAVAAGIAFARLASTRPAPLACVSLLVFAGLVVDGWMLPMPLPAPPARAILPEVPGAAVLELPGDDDMLNTAAMYRSILHGYPLVNGFSGHTPPHYGILKTALGRGDPTVIVELARSRPLLVGIHSTKDPDGHYLGMLRSIPGVEPLGVVTSAGRIFRVPRQPAAPRPPAGDRLPATQSLEGFERLILDLGDVRTVRTVGFPMRSRFEALGDHIEVEGSVDGTTWQSYWLDWTGGVSLRGAIEHPREVPIRLVLPDVRVRYLRVHPAPVWMQREIQAYGPM
jgi:hypothetical protein